MTKKAPILEIYNNSVDWYSSQRTQSLMEKKYLDQMISGLTPSGTVLDIGCGIGKPIAEYLYSKGFAITGIDGSENMIQKAKELQPNCKWTVADMRTLSLNQKFDAVIAWDSFFHLIHDEQRMMFDIFHKHLKLGGMLMFTSGPREGEAIGEMNGYELYHSSLSAKEYSEILNAKGFQVIDHQVEDPECGGHTVWIAHRIN